MKPISILILILSFLDPNKNIFGQTGLEIDLDHLVHISRANIAHEIKYLNVGKVIEITYWEHGCDMMKPIQRTLNVERNEYFYTISYCELKRNFTNKEFWPVIDDFSKSLLTMDPNDACTTTKKIVIKNNFAFYLGIDGSCKWKGFTDLTLSIFNVLPHEPVDKICLKDW